MTKPWWWCPACVYHWKSSPPVKEQGGGDTFNPVYRANSKSLSEELRRLTSCSYPPNMYIALARTQAEWPSLAPGTVPEILGMNHLWVSVKMQHLTLSTVVMDASSHLTATVSYSVKSFWTPHASVMYRYSTGLRIRLESPSAVFISAVTNIYPHPACAMFPLHTNLEHKSASILWNYKNLVDLFCGLHNKQQNNFHLCMCFWCSHIFNDNIWDCVKL